MGVGVGVGVGEGVGDGDGDGEVLGVGVGVELGVGEGVGDPPSPLGSLLDKSMPNMTYATRNNSKQAHTTRKISFLLPIFLYH